MLRRLLLVLGVIAAVYAFVGIASAATTIPGQYIVVLKDSVAGPSAVAAEHGRKYGVQRNQVYRYALKGYSAKISDAGLRAIRDDPRVAFVEPDREFKLAEPASTACKKGSCPKLPPPCEPPACDPQQGPQVPSAGVDRIDGDLSSTRSGDGQGAVDVNVAVLDGGVDVDHVDLSVRGGVDCADGKGIDDRDGHGTMVAGFIAAKDNSFGRVGIAPGAPIWAARVARRDGFVSNSHLICGVDWVTGTRLDADTTNDIAIANMSLGGDYNGAETCTDRNAQAVRLAICRLGAAGVVPVASAGNEEIDLASQEPAAYNDVLTATAMGDNDRQPGGLGGHFQCLPEQSDDEFAFFSNFATLASDRGHVVAAPGVCIGSTFPGNLYAVGSGTSFAAPLVSGTVALCIASGSRPCAGLTPAQIIQKIVADATAYNTANTGYGFLGDPLDPVAGKYFGYLIRAGLY
jgi:subtilisin